jgi:outer membrane lipoprotein SlyB
MKKFLAGLVVLFMLMVSVPLSAEAHNGCPRHRKARKSYASRNYRARAVQPRYANYGAVYEKPSLYRRHRNLINLGVATGGGALIGALLGGKRGALIGTGVGAGSGALYTYVLNKKKRRYTSRYYQRYGNR